MKRRAAGVVAALACGAALASGALHADGAALSSGACSEPVGQDAPAAPASPAAAPREWRVEAIRAEAAGAVTATAPEAVPSALRELLAPEGLRVVGPDGKVRAELWWRATLPLAEKAIGGGFALGRLVPGSFVGVLRAPGGTADYRDQAIDAGTYGLRYFHQPSDGNHLGTSETRDFLVLTSLAEEKSPEDVTSKEALLALAVTVSPSDHALVLYVTTASEPAPADGAPRVVKRGEVEEQALECAVSGQVAGAAAGETVRIEPLRIAVVIEGHTAH